MKVIEAKDLSKRFKEVLAVDQVSFEVNEGEILGFLGPNGAGKSTTIRILTTLTRPTSGTAIVAGYDILREPSKVREKIGLVSEKTILYDRLTAMENLMFFAKLNGLDDKKARKRCLELLEVVDMLKWKDTMVGKFSTGMRQRINVIRALLHDPKIIFLDEPTLGLDPQTTRAIREFIRKMNDEGRTIILTTHMMTEADMLSDRIAIIDHGKIVALDTPKNLKRLLKDSDDEIFDLEVPGINNEIVEKLSSIDCVKKVISRSTEEIRVFMKCDNAVGFITNFFAKHSLKIISIKSVEPSLEDVFIKLTGHEMRDQAVKKMKFIGRRMMHS
ncbi:MULTISPECIES: ABC transporter ATP-binding protein [Kosmotoga]|uniref:Daunorubicin resistance ABC transporter ATPase subunit n=1 Tax=Kosmotoga olearia (strain ATCC BAA-1733 / DSM 21960 / TBF 19.5.1) TaxID=521045 RepID=C5CG92_KOSOT|nr:MULTISPECIES: ATP-binding cassette domain-containing protein [Kosmotoga]ACR79533.1 daunorubicin resistance ABC transporter ATPase subunit [Kosmotoga olearia TBF 19.5.1]OAA22091.1 ABC transporter ATPase [Kosmotoga sp. DU53]